MLFVQTEDAGTVGSGEAIRDANSQPGAHASQRTPILGGVQRVAAVGARGRLRFDLQQCPKFDALAEPALDGLRAAGKVSKGSRHERVFGQVTVRDERGRSPSLLGEAGDPEEGEQRSGAPHLGEDSGEEKIG